MEGNNNNNSGNLRINTVLYRCRYFCSHFYQAYQSKEKIHGIFARFDGHEGIFMCQKCHVTLREYITPNTPEFFTEIRKCSYNILFHCTNHLVKWLWKCNIFLGSQKKCLKNYVIF